ncbi:hypothetical protein VP01_3917g2 [Puccinia sorghi]|uniref:rRNA methyltransferase 2, mitochondrial n=1 Tax=Puccinia sorghi TaxID=27349 RepID=A0A0L6USK9_9BASI|nr:hypothetical protein VP01_3917g2 [Puccinia sorghi]
MAWTTRSFSILRAGGEQGNQSKRFLRRAETDPYGKAKSRARGELAYVARSAHKLIQLDQQFRIFPGARPPTRDAFRVLDLGAAPGGWSQVVLERLARLHYSNRELPIRTPREPPHRLVACDLLPLHPSIASQVSTNVDFHSIQGDFMDVEVRARISQLLNGTNPRVDDDDPIDGREEGEKGLRSTTIILSDMLHSMTGIPTRDSQSSLDLSTTVADLARDLILASPPGPSHAAAGDTLILKHLQSEFTHQFRQRLLADWATVKWVKPLASRAESREGFFVTRGRRAQSQED